MNYLKKARSIVERRVLRLLDSRRTHKQIAAQVGCSREHVSRIAQKFGKRRGPRKNTR